jgi:hypothetical protein
MGPCGTFVRLVQDHRASLSEPVDDQAWFGAHYLSNKYPIVLDHSCQIFQNLIGRSVDVDFEWDDTLHRWRNTTTRTTPSVLHGNGPAESRELLFDVMGPRAGV